MAYLRPGVYVEEVATLAPVTGSVSDTVAAFIGAVDRGPVVPTLVTSWANYTSLYGSWATYNKVTNAVYMFFANGGSQCYVHRVLGTGSPATATRTFNDTNTTPANTLTINAKNPGSWGNKISIEILASARGANYFNLVVYYNGNTSSNVVERFSDLTMNVNDGVSYAITVINANSSYIVAVDAVANDSFEAADNPAVVAPSAATELAGGTDGTAPTDTVIAAAVTNFDSITNSLVLNAPGVTASANVNSLITYAEGRGDVFLVVDGDSGSTTATAEVSTASAYTASANAAVYYPNLVIPDPTSNVAGATVTVPSGAAVVAKYVTTDASRGVFKSPAGLETRLANVVSVAKLSNADLDTMNSATKPVNAIRYIPGSGIVVMGARTLKATYNDRYVAIRRTLIFLRKQLSELSAFAIFEPNNEALWARVTNTIESALVTFWQQGGLRGVTPQDAFYVKCDSTTNTNNSIQNGEVNVEVGVALQRPAEFIVIRISQYDSGAVVTIS